MQYLRDDIYFCEGCGQFFDIETDKLVEVPYWEMPAQYALDVMLIRKKQYNVCHLGKRRYQKIKSNGKRFGR